MRHLVTVIVAAAVSAGTYVVMHLYVAPALPVSTEEARGLLEPRGLLLVLDGERVDDKVAAGTVAEQRPLGGSRLRRSDEVHATLARAGEPLHVPKLAGLTVDAARAALHEARLRAGNVVPTPSDATPGTVTGSTPPAGADALRDALVDLTVSSGPATQPVPSVIGKRLSSAKGVLEKAGFAVGGTRYGSNDDYDQGVIISQNPPAGSQASPGVKIDLTIND